MTVNRSFNENTQGKATVSNRLLRVIGIVALAAFEFGCSTKDFGADSLSPNSGSLTGGDSITIFGGGFRSDVGMAVYFGAVRAENVVVRDAETISVTIPPAKAEGKVDLRIVTDDGKEILLKQAFEYVNKTTGGSETKEVQSIDQRKNLRE
jgi:hypothetical protein